MIKNAIHLRNVDKEGTGVKQTDQNLLEQMRITEFEIANRKALFALNEDDFELLREFRSVIENQIDAIVSTFYEMQTNITEIALLIGDSDTLSRLQSAQRRYVLDLFSGVYDLEYVNNRLRIGLVHKRIGVEPKLYLSAIHTLKMLLEEVIVDAIKQQTERRALISALDKLFLFDITLVFETYIRSLVSEIETSKKKSERYAMALEEKVRERTQQLEEMTRLDPLTGMQNVRYLNEVIIKTLRACKRRSEPMSLVYIDVDDFKIINDTQGHQYGDVVLRGVCTAIKKVSRLEDNCFRYGGDELCIILPNCTEEQARDIYVDRLTLEIRKNFDNVYISVGISHADPHDNKSPEELIRLADERMFAAKKIIKSNEHEQTNVKPIRGDGLQESNG